MKPWVVFAIALLAIALVCTLAWRGVQAIYPANAHVSHRDNGDKVHTINGHPIVCIDNSPGKAYDLLTSQVLPYQECSK